MKGIIQQVKEIVICNNLTWEAGDPVMTPYGEGRIIDIRKQNGITTYVVVLSFGVGYMDKKSLQPYQFKSNQLN
tara:strand:+ start:101 stop:322 length:222 start_codon:yes stop_codon:yes gene_type:complete